ncbi:hypothetical protein NL676_038427 [Syzygium grande]|nr:hypothetical protein NL676_038427 [Syzygium grande]
MDYVAGLGILLLHRFKAVTINRSLCRNGGFITSSGLEIYHSDLRCNSHSFVLAFANRTPWQAILSLYCGSEHVAVTS